MNLSCPQLALELLCLIHGPGILACRRSSRTRPLVSQASSLGVSDGLGTNLAPLGPNLFRQCMLPAARPNNAKATLASGPRQGPLQEKTGLINLSSELVGDW